MTSIPASDNILLLIFLALDLKIKEQLFTPQLDGEVEVSIG